MGRLLGEGSTGHPSKEAGTYQGKVDMFKISLARTCKKLDQHREQNITTNQSISHIIIACSNERPKDCMDNNYSLKESDVIPLCMTICGAGLHVHLSGSLGRDGQREKCWSSWTAMLRSNMFISCHPCHVEVEYNYCHV